MADARLLRFRGGAEATWASLTDLESLAADLGCRQPLTGTLHAWRPVALQEYGAVEVHILGIWSETREPGPSATFRITSAVVALDLDHGLAATRSGSLYGLGDRDERTPSSLILAALRSALAHWGLVEDPEVHQ